MKLKLSIGLGMLICIMMISINVWCDDWYFGEDRLYMPIITPTQNIYIPTFKSTQHITGIERYVVEWDIEELVEVPINQNTLLNLIQLTDELDVLNLYYKRITPHKTIFDNYDEASKFFIKNKSLYPTITLGILILPGKDN